LRVPGVPGRNHHRCPAVRVPVGKGGTLGEEDADHGNPVSVRQGVHQSTPVVVVVPGHGGTVVQEERDHRGILGMGDGQHERVAAFLVLDPNRGPRGHEDAKNIGTPSCQRRRHEGGPTRFVMVHRRSPGPKEGLDGLGCATGRKADGQRGHARCVPGLGVRSRPDQGLEVRTFLGRDGGEQEGGSSIFVPCLDRGSGLKQLPKDRRMVGHGRQHEGCPPIPINIFQVRSGLYQGADHFGIGGLPRCNEEGAQALTILGSGVGLSLEQRLDHGGMLPRQEGQVQSRITLVRRLIHRGPGLEERWDDTGVLIVIRGVEEGRPAVVILGTDRTTTVNRLGDLFRRPPLGKDQKVRRRPLAGDHHQADSQSEPSQESPDSGRSEGSTRRTRNSIPMTDHYEDSPGKSLHNWGPTWNRLGSPGPETADNPNPQGQNTLSFFFSVGENQRIPPGGAV